MENFKIYTPILPNSTSFERIFLKIYIYKHNVKIYIYNCIKFLQIYNIFDKNSTFYKFIFKFFYIYNYLKFLQFYNFFFIFSTFYKLKNGQIYNLQ